MELEPKNHHLFQIPSPQEGEPLNTHGSLLFTAVYGGARGAPETAETENMTRGSKDSPAEADARYRKDCTRAHPITAMTTSIPVPTRATLCIFQCQRGCLTLSPTEPEPVTVRTATCHVRCFPAEARPADIKTLEPL